MRIVHLYKDYYPPTVGGIEQTVERLATWMARRGAEVTVVTSHPRSWTTNDEIVDGVRVIRCAESARVWSTPFCLGMAGQLAKLEADLYHLHFPSPPGEVSWLLTRPRGAMVMTWHGDIVRQKAVLPIYGNCIHALLRATDLVMPTFEGQAARSPFLRHYPTRCRVVPLGIDLERFAVAAPDPQSAAALRVRLRRRPLVLFVGRVVGSKGLDVLLDAIPAVAARFVIVGDGPELERSAQRSTALGLDDRVTFTGRVPTRAGEGLHRARDVGVLPSIASHEILRTLDGRDHGARDPDGLHRGGHWHHRSSIATGRPAWSVAPGDPHALAEALTRLLREPEAAATPRRARAERAPVLFSIDVDDARHPGGVRGGARRAGPARCAARAARMSGPLIVDLRYATARFPAAGTHGVALARALLAARPAWRWRFLVPREPDQDLSFLPPGSAQVWREPQVGLAQRALGRLLDRRRAALFHSPFVIRPWDAGCPAIVTVLDVRPLADPEADCPVKPSLYRRLVRDALAAEFLVCAGVAERAAVLAAFPKAADAPLRTVGEDLRDAGPRSVARLLDLYRALAPDLE